jgi:hypothetical protein
MPVALHSGFTAIYKIDWPEARQCLLHLLQIYNALVSKATQIFLYFPGFHAVFLALFAAQCKDSHIDASQIRVAEVVLFLQAK